LEKFRHGGENSPHGNRKTAGKNSGMVGKCPEADRKFLPVHPLYRPGFPFPFCISVICHAVGISTRDNQANISAMNRISLKKAVKEY
jgi:hypothetical protein